jgi:drug/metabolite transporter (DMT)-like permease
MPYLLLVLTTLFWSGNFVLSRGMHAEMPPVALALWRWLLALAILLPFAWSGLRRQRRLLVAHRAYLVSQGLLGVTGFNTLLYQAMQTTTAINAVLVNSSIPVLIALICWGVYRETLRPRQLLGVAVSLFGVVMILTRGEPGHLLTIQLNRGDLWVLLAALTWACYSANLRRYPADLHPLVYQVAITVCGLVGILPWYLWERLHGAGFTWGPATLATVGYVAVFASVLAFLFWNRAVREVGANRAGPFVHLMPLFSTLMATLFLGESFGLFHFKGMVLIFTGILLTSGLVDRLGRRYRAGRRVDGAGK